MTEPFTYLSGSLDNCIECRVPSIFDGSKLQCRIYHPISTSGSLTYNKIAIVAHPYAPLGGSYNDHVVLTLVRCLASEGWVVCTFNFRSGISIPFVSTGTTISSSVEQIDYHSVRIFVLQYLKLMRVLTIPKNVQEHDDAKDFNKLQVLLCGYSYGSMIASYLDPNVFDERLKTGALTYNLRDAEMSSIALLTATRVFGAGVDAERAQSVTSTLPDRPLEYSYLLVSPLLPPVSWMLAPKFRNPFASRMEADVEKRLTSNRCLAVFGGHDVFNSADKLLDWARSLRDEPETKFRFEYIEPAGHFWAEPETMKILQRALRSWLSEHANIKKDHIGGRMSDGDAA